MNDGGFIVCGNKLGDPNSLYLLKVTSSGLKEWEKTFSGPYSSYAYSLDLTGNDGFILLGSSPNNELSGIDLMKFDSTGNIEWENHYNDIYSSTICTRSIQRTKDNGYIILGKGGSNTISLMKTDSIGLFEWKQDYSKYLSTCSSVDQTDEGGYLLSGGSSNGKKIWMIKTNPMGNVIDNGFSIRNSKVVIQNCIIENFDNYGMILASRPIVSNCLINNNSNGVMFSTYDTQYFVNNTIVNNENYGLFFEQSDARLINNIIYGNGNYNIYICDDYSDPSFFYNDIEGGQSGFGLQSDATFNGEYENNIDSNPLFLNDSFVLSGESPCIDTGSPEITVDSLNNYNIPFTDLYGNPRLYWSKIDIGCCETQESSISENNIVKNHELFQNYPNPFNPTTIISYSIKQNADVKLKIFNILGKEICQLVSEKQSKGMHNIKFNADMITSGIYFYQLTVNDKIITNKKMILLK